MPPQDLLLGARRSSGRCRGWGHHRRKVSRDCEIQTSEKVGVCDEDSKRADEEVVREIRCNEEEINAEEVRACSARLDGCPSPPTSPWNLQTHRSSLTKRYWPSRFSHLSSTLPTTGIRPRGATIFKNHGTILPSDTHPTPWHLHELPGCFWPHCFFFEGSHPARATDAKDVFKDATFFPIRSREEAQLSSAAACTLRLDEKYPLVLYPARGFQRGDDNKGQLTHGMSDFASDENREKYPVSSSPRSAPPRISGWISSGSRTTPIMVPPKP